MCDLNSIEETMKKLENDKTPGEVKYIPRGRDEKRYAYYLRGRMAFTFGLTRSSKGKSKKYYYVPRQMSLTINEYRKIHDCTLDKEYLNSKLIDSDRVLG